MSSTGRPRPLTSARKGYEDRYASMRTDAVRTAVLDSGDYVGPSFSEWEMPMTGAQKIGELSVKLADAALIARERGDDVNAIFFAIKAAETLALAKALGWKPDASQVPTGDRG